MAEGLRLQGLASPQAVRSLQILPQHYRSHWLTGFGWDQNLWATSEFPDKKILDLVFADAPVFFSRVDGHASWLNSRAISELTFLGFDFSKDPEGGRILRSASDEPTGILLDTAHIRALQLLPDFLPEQHQLFFQSSQKIFNRAGITHVRDLSMTLAAWNLLRTLEEQKNLTVALDAFVTAESLADLDRVLNEISEIQKNPSQQMRLHGVKIFTDGSLGSKTALLSEPYLNSGEFGIWIWPDAHIKTLLTRVWKLGLQVAVHTIGDQAAHRVVKAAREVSSAGLVGRLHLEHVQILRPETIQLMKPLHVTCYLQPCHWLSDHSWLKTSISVKLVENLFPWEALRKNKIPFFFGSDSPIEPVSLFANLKALQKSAEWGVPALGSDWRPHHTHPDLQFCPSYTEISDNQIQQVWFMGKPLLKS